MTNPPTVVLTVGLPGSGKSYWTQGQVDINPDAWRVVSKDDIRERHGLPFGTDEANVMHLSLQAVAIYVAHGFDVVYDGVNLAPKTRRRVIETALDAGATYRFKVFTDVPLATCLERNRLRMGAARLPDSAIVKLHHDCIQSGTWSKGIDLDRILP